MKVKEIVEIMVDETTIIHIGDWSGDRADFFNDIEKNPKGNKEVINIDVFGNCLYLDIIE